MIVDILIKTLARDRHEVLSDIMEFEYNTTLQSGSIGK